MILKFVEWDVIFLFLIVLQLANDYLILNVILLTDIQLWVNVKRKIHKSFFKKEKRIKTRVDVAWI